MNGTSSTDQRMQKDPRHGQERPEGREDRGEGAQHVGDIRVQLQERARWLLDEEVNVACHRQH